MRVLLSFVGNRDPFGADTSEPGPVLSLLEAESFDAVTLFCTGSNYMERARSIQVELGKEGPAVHYVVLDIDSPVDYGAIYGKLKASLQKVIGAFSHRKARYSVLLDPGTPQMQTSWFLLVASGQLDAEMLQGTPPRFAGGAYKVRRVDLSEPPFPDISIKSLESRRPTEGEPSVLFQSGGLHLPGGEIPDSIVGDSPAFRQALERAVQIAPYGDLSVLIRGETGSGKGVVSKLIHDRSSRSGPLVVVNCAAITPGLVESELFGHVKGAFTGAAAERLGQFRAADQGTIFLDEIGDLPLEVQPKLLHVLEDRELTPVGSDKSVSIDVRVLAATHRDLESMIDDGTFRRDLYERLNQVTIDVPPLRERRSDIPELIRYFVRQWNRKYGETKSLSPEAMQLMQSHDWPGNVRELANTVTRVCALGRGAEIPPELLPPQLLHEFRAPSAVGDVMLEIPDRGLDLKAYLYQIEEHFYRLALERSTGNKEQAARLLGINGAAFRKALRERFDIEEPTENDRTGPENTGSDEGARERGGPGIQFS